MSGMQRTYKIKPIRINGVKIVQVVVDSHYEEKHGDHMSDELILALVQELDGRFEIPEAKKGRYSYFATLIDSKYRPYPWKIEEKLVGTVYTLPADIGP